MSTKVVGRKCPCTLAIATVVLMSATAFGAGWQFIGPSGGTVDAIFFSPAAPNVMFLQAYDMIFKSRSYGLDWSKLSISGQLRVHPSQKKLVVFKRNSNNGFWASIDLGETWHFVAGSAGNWIYDIQFDPRDSNRLYMLANGNDSVVVLSTRDGGASWTSLPKPNVPDNSTSGILRVSRNGQLWMIDSRTSIYRLSPGQQSWVLLSQALPCCDNAQDFLSLNGTLWSAGKHGIFRSSDGGVTWNLVKRGNFWSLSYDPIDISTVYAAGIRRLPSKRGYAVKTTDSGDIWEDLRVSQKVSYLSVRVDPLDPQRMCLGTEDDGILCSTDKGMSWMVRNNGFNAREVVGIFSRRSVLYAYTDRQLLLTRDDGATWIKTGLGALVGRIGSVAVHPTNEDILAANGDNALFLSKDSGLTWKQVRAPESGGILFDPHSPTVLHMVSFDRTYKSTDFGETWVGLPKVPMKTFCCIESYAIGASTPPTLFVGSDDGLIYRSTDEGRSWQPKVLPTYYPVYQVAVNPKNALIVYAESSAEDSMHFLYPVLLGSRDGGNTWTELEPLIQRVRINPTVPSELFSFEFYYPLISKDGGMTWQFFPDNGIPRSAGITDLSIDPSSPKQLYISTTQGLYRYLR